MLLEIIIALLGAALTVVLGAILRNVIVVTYVYYKFQKNLRGFKIAAGFSPIDGHLRSLIFSPSLIHDMDQLMEKYGKTFGLLLVDNQAVFTHDLDLIKRMIVDEQSNNRLQAMAPLKEAKYGSILLSNGEQWRRLRRSIAPALKSNKFKAPNCLREIDGSIGKLVDAIERRFSQAPDRDHIELDIYDLAHRYSLDLALSCLYKQNRVIDFDSESDFMTKTVDDGLDALMLNPVVRYALSFSILNPVADWLMLHCHVQGTWRKMLMGFIKQQTKISLEARKQIRRARELGQTMAEDNFLLEDGTKFSRNLIDHIIDHYHEGKLTSTEYFHSTWSLLSAADKTSADGITHTLYQLAIQPDIQDKLRHSIRSDGLESEYLAWVLNESLRLLPPAISGCTRVIENDMELDNGNVIPANTLVLTPAYSIHRLPEYWGPDALEFKPERFADTSNFHPFQYLPFGAGARSCPGKEFALFEMKRLLCRLVSRYKFQCEPLEQKYSAPMFTFVIKQTRTIIRISRLEGNC